MFALTFGKCFFLPALAFLPTCKFLIFARSLVLRTRDARLRLWLRVTRNGPRAQTENTCRPQNRFRCEFVLSLTNVSQVAALESTRTKGDVLCEKRGRDEMPRVCLEGGSLGGAPIVTPKRFQLSFILCFASEAGEKLEPPVGFEPTTYVLRIRERSRITLAD